MTAIIQAASIGNVSGFPDTLTLAWPVPPTPGNELIAIHCLNLPDAPTFPVGYTELTIIDVDTTVAWLGQNIHAAVKTATGSEPAVVVTEAPTGDRSTLTIFEVPPGTFNSGRVKINTTSMTWTLPNTVTTNAESILIGIIAEQNAGWITSLPPGWVQEEEVYGVAGSNGLLTPSFSTVVGPGTHGGSISIEGNGNGPAVVFDYVPDAPVTPPPPDPGPIGGVFDPGDVFIGDLTEAFDWEIRCELNGTGYGRFAINRYSAEATAALLTPGNYVRVTIPQIDPNPIFGFFLEKGDFKLVSSDEEGGEVVHFEGRGGLSYWDRAIWLAESFLVQWWPAYIEAAHGAPPAGTIGAVSMAPGWSAYRYTLSGGNLITSRTPARTVNGFSSYYDRRLRVHDSDGNYTTLVHLTTGGVSGWWVKPYGANVRDWRNKGAFYFGNSVLMESIDDGDKPGQVLYAMYGEAKAADRPQDPIPGMTIDFDQTLDSDGNAWTTSDAMRGVSSQLHDTYLSTVEKLVNTGAVDVVMGPDLDFHAYNAYARDLHGSIMGPGVVRFAKGVNIADELAREFSDSPIATFTEISGRTEGVIARATLPSAAGRAPREIGLNGDTDDVTALEALGQAELAVRLLHSDAIGFAVATPIIGMEDPDNGLYLPGPPGSANGNYWYGDLVTLHTGSAENDFDEETVRVAAITISTNDAGDLRVVTEVGSGFGGLANLDPGSGLPGSTAGGGGGGSTVSDLYQLVSERDSPNGYPTLDDDGMIDPSQNPTQWKQSVRFATTAAVTLATGFEAGDVVDGVTLVEGDDFLNKDAAAGAENGIWIVAATGAPTRRPDYDADIDIVGSVVQVREGTVNAGTFWRNTNTSVPTIGTTALTFDAMLAGGVGSGTVDTATDGTTTVNTPDTIEILGTGGIAVTVTESPSGTASFEVDGSSISGGSGALVLLEQHTASASASLDFTTCISSTYDEYLIEFLGIMPATNTQFLWMRMSTDGGSTYVSTGSYSWDHYVWRGGGNALQGGTAQTQIVLNFASGAVSNAVAGLPINGSIRLFSPGDTTQYKTISGRFVYYDGNRVINEVRGSYESATAVNAFRFLISSGNIASGIIRVYGLAK